MQVIKPLDKERTRLVLTTLKTIVAPFSIHLSDSYMDNGCSETGTIKIKMLHKKLFLCEMKINGIDDMYSRNIEGGFDVLWQKVESGTLLEEPWMKTWNMRHSPMYNALRGVLFSKALITASRALSQEHNLHVIDN